MDLKLVNSLEKRCHRNCITSLSFDGFKIVSGGKDSTLLLHQRSESCLICVSKYDLSNTNINKCNVTCVDYLDGLALASTTLGVINVVDTSSHDVSAFNAHRDVSSCVKFFTKDKNLIISSGFDRKTRVWDLRNLKVPIHDLIGHTANVNYLDNLNFDIQNEDLIQFSENYEKILSCSSDRTIRLWNVNNGTHLAFKVPIEMSQNIESCCVLFKKPNYIFAVGLDDNYLLIYSSKLKNYIGMLSLGSGTSVNCIRRLDDTLISLGTNKGNFYLVNLNFNDNFTKCNVDVLHELDYDGSVNDFKVDLNSEFLTIYGAIGSELRLGRWSTNPNVKNHILINQYRYK